MSWQKLYSNPSARSVCFDVRSGMGTTTGQGTFTDVIDNACRVPKQHSGWQSVEDKGRRFQLYGGIRTNWFIVLRSASQDF